MADLAQPLLPGNGSSNGGNGKLPADSPFASDSQQDLEGGAPVPAAARKDGDAEDAGAQIARKVMAAWV